MNMITDDLADLDQVIMAIFAVPNAMKCLRGTLLNDTKSGLYTTCNLTNVPCCHQ